MPDMFWFRGTIRFLHSELFDFDVCWPFQELSPQMKERGCVVQNSGQSTSRKWHTAVLANYNTFHEQCS